MRLSGVYPDDAVKPDHGGGDDKPPHPNPNSDGTSEGTLWILLGVAVVLLTAAVLGCKLTKKRREESLIFRNPQSFKTPISSKNARRYLNKY
mmetsp:Transcript_3517/g.6018  ORF Transcript_3517/g.6018 Transcript_3517/m.6018 type:complete len:92 (-) Transcript_3517:36-311(-)